MLDGVFASKENEVKNFIEANGYDAIDLNTDEGRRLAAEEYLSNQAGKLESNSKLKGVYAKIRGMLRKIFPKLRFTDREIAGILSNSRKQLTKNKAAAGLKKFIPLRFSLMTNNDAKKIINLPGEERTQPKLKLNSVKEYYEWFENNLVGKKLVAPNGKTMTLQPGHFFKLIAGTPPKGQKREHCFC